MLPEDIKTSFVSLVQAHHSPLQNEPLEYPTVPLEYHLAARTVPTIGFGGRHNRW